MIEIKYLITEDLGKHEIDNLWNQDVCMDDWDYILIVDELKGVIY